MKILDVKAGETDVYIRVHNECKPVNVYQVQISKRKLTAQLNGVKGFVKDLVLKFKR